MFLKRGEKLCILKRGGKLCVFKRKSPDCDCEYARLAIQTNFALDKYQMNPICSNRQIFQFSPNICRRLLFSLHQTLKLEHLRQCCNHGWVELEYYSK